MEKITLITDTDNIYDYITNNFGITIGGTNYQKIYDWSLIFPLDVLLYAVDISVANGVRTIKYWEGILNNWKGKNYKNLEEIIEKEKNKKNEIIPEWFDKEIQKEYDINSQNEMEELLKDFK